jgi:hypothetical protein
MRSSKHEGQERRSGHLGPESAGEIQSYAPPAHSMLNQARGSIHDNLPSLEPKVKIKGSKKD